MEMLGRGKGARTRTVVLTELDAPVAELLPCDDEFDAEAEWEWVLEEDSCP